MSHSKTTTPPQTRHSKAVATSWTSQGRAAAPPSTSHDRATAPTPTQSRQGDSTRRQPATARPTAPAGRYSGLTYVNHARRASKPFPDHTQDDGDTLDQVGRAGRRALRVPVRGLAPRPADRADEDDVARRPPPQGRTVSAVEVLITCMEQPETRVRLHECVAFDQDITTMAVELRAHGLEAQLGIEVLDHDRLPGSSPRWPTTSRAGRVSAAGGRVTTSWLWWRASIREAMSSCAGGSARSWRRWARGVPA